MNSRRDAPSLSPEDAAVKVGLTIKELRAAQKRGEVLGFGSGRSLRYTEHALSMFLRWRAQVGALAVDNEIGTGE